MERRSFDATLELRAGESGNATRTLSGYAAVFGAWSEDLGGFRERLERGAFRSAMSGDVRALWNHDAAFVLGRTTNGTLRLEEDARGLKVEIDAPIGALYDGFLENVRRGDVTQMSFGFSVLEDEKSFSADGERLRVLKQVRLYEVSPVTFPAYTQTEVSLREWGEQPDTESTDWMESAENSESDEQDAGEEVMQADDADQIAESTHFVNTEVVDAQCVDTESKSRIADGVTAGAQDKSLHAEILRRRRIRLLRA